MDRLRFYSVDPNYILHLRAIDSKVPEIVVGGHVKPYCGVVLELNGFKYYAPISSFKTQQATNFVIKGIMHKVEQSISSIRFCFMIPVPDKVLTQVDFNSHSGFYKNLLEMEYRYCNKHIKTIRSRADAIYKICLDPNNPITSCCCNFTLLEIASESY